MSDPVLQQSEVDQLVSAIRAGKIPNPKGSLEHVHETVPIDLSDPGWSQDRIVRRRLPVLDLVFGRLGPSLQITLTKSLRFPIRTENAGIELIKFGDFRQRYEDKPCLFEVMRLDPLRGLSVMTFDCTILYALIDALMGGLGVGELPMNREVSEIEESLLHKPHLDMLRDLESAWKPWFPLRVEHVRCDRTVQVLSTIADEEVCHVGTVNVAGDVLPTSPIHFVMPYSSMEPLLEATSARGGEEIDPNWRVNLVQNLRDTPAEVRALLGYAELSTSEIGALAPGSLIELDRRTDQDIDLEVENQQIYRGRIGRSHHNYGMKVTERREGERKFLDRTAGQILVRKGLISREQLAVALIDERINRRQLLDSIVGRGWVERRVLESALQL